jgi:hypothetical protein
MMPDRLSPREVEVIFGDPPPDDLTEREKSMREAAAELIATLMEEIEQTEQTEVN